MNNIILYPKNSIGTRKVKAMHRYPIVMSVGVDYLFCILKSELGRI